MASKKTRDYDQDMSDAVDNSDFAAWQKAYRARNAAQPGPYINGQPAAQVVGMGAPVEAAPPTLAQSNVADPGKIAAAADAIGIRVAQNQSVDDDEAKARYNRFLRDSGIDPSGIGNGTVVDGQLQQPTLTQVQQAQDLQNARSGLHSRYTQLAAQSRNPAFAQQMLEQRDYAVPTTGTTDSQANLRYWLNRLRTSRQIAASNGFAG